MGVELPAELWLQIFRLAVDDDPLLDHVLPTSMDVSSWHKLSGHPHLDDGGWALKTPHELLALRQMRSYATKKAILSTCRTWRQLGLEFLFRFLFFDDPSGLMHVCPVLDRESKLGWWTKRLHITRFYAAAGTTFEETQNSLVSIIRHCPNLEIFIIHWPIHAAAPTVIDTLCTFCHRSLRTISLVVRVESLAKVILLLDSLPLLEVVNFAFDGSSPEFIPLGSMSNITLTLPSLRQLSLRGAFQDFLEQASEWTMPALRVASFDFLQYREDLPDFVEFLTHHGAELTFLDIDCIPTLDISTILDLCPLLTTFCFNPDWRLPGADAYPVGESEIVRRPHRNIRTIGCHQLLYALGAGFAARYAEIDPLSTRLIRRQNDANFAALNKRNFPQLQCVRALSIPLLRHLEAQDGPDRHSDCYDRWQRWFDQCAHQDIRLEDCTGALLGELPKDDCEVDSTETEEDTSQTLRELLAECKRMLPD
ncbi:hypothetical protein OBBRIDRAFT_719949 [Obba rivulosa]|uniref:Uncharacterized protein n=1 Tax=Obba rivulosa TaxID=1052685 RepID=A0A8E2J7Y1_9APHY|nr:hypothetical protein OBBRIDRAFT_719949 [Obba rivulosa]